MDSLRIEDIWPLVERLSPEERKKLRAMLAEQPSNDETFWLEIDKIRGRLAEAGCSFKGDDIIQLIREDRDTR